MRRIRRGLLIGATFAALTMGGSTQATAMTCERDIEPACRAAATVICKVVAKGQPCLM